MALGDNTYFRLVAWLKILLPVAALGLLSVLFLLSRPDEPAEVPRWLEGRGQDRPASEQVTRPTFAGMTDDGTSLTLTARRARPDPQHAGRAMTEELRGVAVLPDGSELRLAARAGVFDESAGEMRISGGVEIESSRGYSLVSEQLTVGFDRLAMDSNGPVAGRGPAGRIEAGRLQVTAATDAAGAQLLFTEGVKLLYDPEE
ncbi:MAG: lipopolysaccharide export system protein LptC [Rhodobacteraceae bacterium HLUCCA24]|nr:MAG: lipopolysaccharide export system protein LptC [Rhodobacteraceae bacterium HLUCCA24]